MEGGEGEERERKKKKRRGKIRQKRKKRENRGRERKKSLPQDSRDVVGIISTFAWMRVLYRRRIQPLPFPTPTSVLGSFFRGVNSAYHMAATTVVP